MNINCNYSNFNLNFRNVAAFSKGMNIECIKIIFLFHSMIIPEELPKSSWKFSEAYVFLYKLEEYRHRVNGAWWLSFSHLSSHQSDDSHQTQLTLCLYYTNLDIYM